MDVKYFAPQSMPEFFECLGQMTRESKIIGGGTDFVIRMNSGACTPDALLYMGGVEKISGIEAVGNTVEIGAMATMSAIGKSGLMTGAFASLADAARGVGCAQIRNSGTIGGNVANASAAGDLIPVLFLLGADVIVATARGELRRERIENVVTGPGKTSLEYNEAIVKFVLNVTQQSARKSAFAKLGFRKTLTISRIGLAVSLEQSEDGIITSALVIAGAISLTPLRVAAAEEYLIGKKLDNEADHAVGKALSDLILKVTPEIFDRDYKVEAAFGIASDTLRKLR